jgi:hypothetical protein
MTQKDKTTVQRVKVAELQRRIEKSAVLNPLHPRADGDAVAAGFKKRFPFS